MDDLHDDQLDGPRWVGPVRARRPTPRSPIAERSPGGLGWGWVVAAVIVAGTSVVRWFTDSGRPSRPLPYVVSRPDAPEPGGRVPLYSTLSAARERRPVSLDGRRATLSPGVLVEVLTTTGGAQYVRVQSGPGRGQEGWIPAGFLSTPPGEVASPRGRRRSGLERLPAGR